MNLSNGNHSPLSSRSGNENSLFSKGKSSSYKSKLQKRYYIPLPGLAAGGWVLAG